MTRQLKKLAHSLYECKYHVVFCPKYRYKILQGEVRQEDHVHVVLSIPPKYAVSEMMGFLKGKLALRTFDRFPELRKRYWGQHLWSRGYCVSTVGLDEERIRKYVKYQTKRDEEATQGRLFD